MDLIRDENLTHSVVLSWANGLVHDVIARVVKPAGKMPRAAFVSPGQEPLPWGVIPATAFPVTARSYIAKFQNVVLRVARLRSILAVLEPWLEENDGTGLTTAEAATLAGVAEDDLLALTA